MNTIFSGLILAGLITFTACQKDLATTADGGFALTAESVECTEAWLSLRLGRAGDYTVTRDDTVTLFNGRLSKDTILHDAGLIPDRDYTYTAVPPEQSGDLQSINITTMDTTGHDFSWQVFEFGGGKGGGILYDVAIIDENDIWAVGEIHTEDTDCWNEDSTEWIPAFNAAHWDGEKWELKHIKVNFRGNLITLPLEGIFAFSSTDIWLVGSLPIHGDGESWTLYDVRETTDSSLSLRKSWGISSEDIYFVGRAGSIVHYNGREWTKIESGIDTKINDIWGVSDKDKTSIYCTSALHFSLEPRILLNIKENHTVNICEWPYNDRSPYSVWFANHNKIFVSGDGLMVRGRNGNWHIENDQTPYSQNKIRGTNINNIFTVGGYGYIAHFNGVTWYELPTLFDGNYISVDVKENITVAVGYGTVLARLIMIKQIKK